MYISCPSCRRRMKRTGKKQVIFAYSDNSVKLFDREYKCPNCGSVWNYDEYRNFIK